MTSKRCVSGVVCFGLLLVFAPVCAADEQISVEATGDLGQLQDYFYDSGDGGPQTVGQTFTAPDGCSELTSWSVYLMRPSSPSEDPIKFRAYLMEWDGSKAQGDFLYRSEQTDTSGELADVRVPFTFDDINVSLDSDKEYVFFISVSEYFGDGLPSTAYPGDNTKDAYLGGSLVTLRNGSDMSALTRSTWITYPSWDLAMTANFTAPEPASTCCLVLGLVALVVRRRHRP